MKFHFLFVYLLIFLFFVQTVFASTPASEPIQLPAIVLEASPSEVLASDPIVPWVEGESGLPSSGGSITAEISKKWALSMSDERKPGALSQIRGLGRSAEDTEVEIFGLSLNPPLGGGFAMGSFPEFLWSSYSFRAGPSLSGLDPRANAGRLSLKPWTSSALLETKSQLVAGESYSSAELNQLYVGYSSSQRFAAMVGMSLGKMHGPSGAISQRFELGDWKAKFHVLGTSTSVRSEGAITAPSPRAVLTQKRVIPVIQVDRNFREGMMLKSSFLFDWGTVQYNDPDQPLFATDDHSQQIGIENAWIDGPWRLGLSAKVARYEKSDFKAPLETLGNLQITRTFGSGPWLIEPTLQAIAVRGFDPSLGVSVGARYELGASSGAFLRGTYSKKYPSLQDRYYDLIPYFYGNSGLKPEKDWTWIAGVDGKVEKAWGWGGQLYFQRRQDAFLQTSNTVTNADGVSIFAATGWVNSRIGESIQIWTSQSVSTSRVGATGDPAPYIPKLLVVFGAQANFFPARTWSESPLQGEITFRGGWGAIAPDRLPADSGATLGMGLSSVIYSGQNKSINLNVTMENVTDSRMELTRGYPIEQRSLTASLKGQF